MYKRQEFYLVQRDPAATHGIRRRVDQLSMVYTVGPQADPDGIVRGMTEALEQLGLKVFAANHEFMNSQYEINLRHTDALQAADRAFRLKSPSRTSRCSTAWWPRSWVSPSTTRVARAPISTSH